MVCAAVDDKLRVNRIAELSRHPVRQSKEYDIVAVQCIRAGFLQSQPKARQVRMQRPERLARIRIRGYRDDVEFRMASQKPHEFAARVTAGTGDRNPQSHDYSRIVALWRDAATATPASLASVASCWVSVRSAARNRSAKVNDFWLSSSPAPR